MKIILKEEGEAEDFIEQIIERAANRIASRVDDRLDEIQQNSSSKKESRWVKSAEAMNILGVKRKKMQQIRDESPMNGIIISQHGRTFLYERASLHKYLKKHILK